MTQVTLLSDICRTVGHDPAVMAEDMRTIQALLLKYRGVADSLHAQALVELDEARIGTARDRQVARGNLVELSCFREYVDGAIDAQQRLVRCANKFNATKPIKGN